MQKALAALLALLTLSTSILTACGGSSDNTAAETTAAQTDETTAAETTEAVAASEYENPGVNYEGAEFCFAAYSSDNYSWQAASYCDAWAESENKCLS